MTCPPPPPPPAHLLPLVPCGATAVGPAMWPTPMAPAPVQATQACRGALLRRPSRGAPPMRPLATAAAAEHTALPHGRRAVLGCRTPPQGTPR